MKVRLIKDCTGPNPKFDPKKPTSFKKVGVNADGTAIRENWPEIDRPKGLEIEHPDAHYLTYGDDPNAEPIDKEAQDAFDEWSKAKTAAVEAREAEEAGQEQG